MPMQEQRTPVELTNRASFAFVYIIVSLSWDIKNCEIPVDVSAPPKGTSKNLKVGECLDNVRLNVYTPPVMRWLFRIQVIATAGAILLARSVVADDWPYYQRDAWHTGNSNASVNPQALSFAWTAPSPPPSTTGYSTPVIVGNTIYAMQESISASQTTVSSFDISTGAIN